MRFMEANPIGAELWAERARASYYMCRCEIAEQAKKERHEKAD
jgi:hypothetical protein